MNTLEIIELINKLKEYYDKDVVIVKSITDYYECVRIETLYGDTLLYDRGQKKFTDIY